MSSADEPADLGDDPSVTAIESLFAAAGIRAEHAARPRGERPAVLRALWICACVSVVDAPTWLLVDDDDGGMAWGRVPDGLEPLALVDARFTAGGHAEPAEVLRWAKGEADDPWAGGGAGGGDSSIVHALGHKIAGLLQP